jgi:hypothetical protein
MLQFLLLSLLTSFGFGQGLSLADYNRTLYTQLLEQKPLPSKEIKPLRIRLGTAIASADDVFFKEGEVLKLLVLATYDLSLRKEKKNTDFIKNSWKKYLSLPNVGKIKFSTDYLLNIFKNKDNEILAFISASNEFLKIIPTGINDNFFFPLILEKCQDLAYLRITPELITCWSSIEKITDGLSEEIQILNEKLDYFSYVYRNESFFELSKKILSDPKLEQMQQVVRWRQLSIKTESGLPFEESELADLVKITKHRAFLNRMLLRHYTNINNLEKALEVFKNLSESDLKEGQFRSFYKYASSLFYWKGDLNRAKFYVDKSIKLEAKPLDQVSLFLTKLILEILIDKNFDASDIKSQFSKISKLIEVYKIDDPELITSNKLFNAIALGPKGNLEDLRIKISEYKKYQFLKEYTSDMADKLYLQFIDNNSK